MEYPTLQTPQQTPLLTQTPHRPHKPVTPPHTVDASTGDPVARSVPRRVRPQSAQGRAQHPYRRPPRYSQAWPSTQPPATRRAGQVQRAPGPWAASAMSPRQPAHRRRSPRRARPVPVNSTLGRARRTAPPGRRPPATHRRRHQPARRQPPLPTTSAHGRRRHTALVGRLQTTNRPRHQLQRVERRRLRPPAAPSGRCGRPFLAAARRELYTPDPSHSADRTVPAVAWRRASPTATRRRHGLAESGRKFDVGAGHRRPGCAAGRAAPAAGKSRRPTVSEALGQPPDAGASPLPEYQPLGAGATSDTAPAALYNIKKKKKKKTLNKKKAAREHGVPADGGPGIIVLCRWYRTPRRRLRLCR